MRLGAQAVELGEGTRARDALRRVRRSTSGTGTATRSTTSTGSSSSTHGLVVSGTFQEGRLVEIVELPDHPWFVASQFHPEFKSRPTRPAPLFREFVGAALERARDRAGVAVAAALTDGRRASTSSSSCAPIPSPPGEERAVADRVLRVARRARARRGRGRRRRRDRLDDGQPARAGCPATTSGTPIFLCAHLDTVPPDGAARAGRRRGRRRAQRRRHDPRRRQQGGGRRRCSRRRAASSAEGIPHAGVELLFTPKEEVGLRRRVRLRPDAARGATSASSTTRRRRSARSSSARRTRRRSRRASTAGPRMPGCIRRTGAPRSRPRRGRSPTSASAGSTRRRPRTSA